jgi:hypothetical protein
MTISRGRKIKETRKKSVPVPPYPPWNPLEIAGENPVSSSLSCHNTEDNIKMNLNPLKSNGNYVFHLL